MNVAPIVDMNSVRASWLTRGPITTRSMSQAVIAMITAAKPMPMMIAAQSGKPLATRKSSERTSASPASNTIAPWAKLKTPDALKISTKPSATSEYSTPDINPPISTSRNWPNAITQCSSVRDAEIGVDDGLVFLDLVRRAVGDLQAMIEHRHAIGEIHDHSHVVLDQSDGRAVMIVHVDDEPRHVLLLLEVHACHRLVEEKKIGLHCKGAAEFNALLKAIWQTRNRHLADRLNLQKIDNLLDPVPMLDLLCQRRAVTQHLPQKAPAHLQGAASHDIVERAHSLEQCDVLKGARDAATGRLERLHPGASPSLEGDGAMIRMIEAVDDIEHRGFAGAVRSDDGANFTLPDVKRNIRQRFHAAKRQRYALDLKQDFVRARCSHAAFPRDSVAPVTCKSRMLTRAAITPLRPSSKVTSVEMSDSWEPS